MVPGTRSSLRKARRRQAETSLRSVTQNRRGELSGGGHSCYAVAEMVRHPRLLRHAPMRLASSAALRPATRALLTCLAACLLARAALGQGLPRARPEAVGLSAAALARIAPALQAYVDSGKLPGLLAAVARHGKLAYLAAVGPMDMAQHRAMSPDAVFRIFSM